MRPIVSRACPPLSLLLLLAAGCAVSPSDTGTAGAAGDPSGPTTDRPRTTPSSSHGPTASPVLDTAGPTGTLGDTGLVKRLHRIICPTLLVWGADDRVIPKSYAKTFAERIAGPTEIVEIPNAGHLVDLDQPDALAEVVSDFLN